MACYLELSANACAFHIFLFKNKYYNLIQLYLHFDLSFPELPTEASYTTEGNGKINIHVSVTINAGTLAELKKQRAQNRNSSPDISVIQTQSSARSSVTGSEMESPSVKRFAGNTGDNIIGDTKVRRCCILS